MREWNQATREEAVDLRIHSAQCAKTIVRAAQFDSTRRSVCSPIA